MKPASDILNELRPAFSRGSTFKWFTIVVHAFMGGPDKGGMAGLVRGLSLEFKCYGATGHFFRSAAFSAKALSRLWLNVACRHAPLQRTSDGRGIVLFDGKKCAKEGARMPGVQKHVQQSGNSAKGEHILGQLWGGVGVVAKAVGTRYCIPLAMTIQCGLAKAFGWGRKKGGGYADACDGADAPDADAKGKKKPGMPDYKGMGEDEIRQQSHVVQCVKAAIDAALGIPGGAVAVGDAGFSSCDAVGMAQEAGVTLITRAKSGCVAFEEPEKPEKPKPGRPAQQGARVEVYGLFESEPESFKHGECEPCGEKAGCMLLGRDLLWGLGRNYKARYALAVTPKGCIVLMGSDAESGDKARLRHQRTFSKPAPSVAAVSVAVREFLALMPEKSRFPIIALLREHRRKAHDIDVLRFRDVV
jgi:hypothetical protein